MQLARAATHANGQVRETFAPALPQITNRSHTRGNSHQSLGLSQPDTG
jgi:hypothetical protein